MMKPNTKRNIDSYRESPSLETTLPMILKNLSSFIASETLAILMPIFETLRARGDTSDSFPMSLSMTSLGLKIANPREKLLRVPKINVSHCHSATDLVCITNDFSNDQ